MEEIKLMTYDLCDITIPIAMESVFAWTQTIYL